MSLNPSSLNLFAQFTKVDAAQRLVYGSLASEVVDKAGEVFDYATSKPHVESWSGSIAKATGGKSEGNLRAMHSNIAAGVFKSVVCNDDTKSVEVCAKVVDDAEWTKVQEGVYTGFSVGGSYVKKWRDGDVTRYTAKPAEGSLVDNPCNPDATFTMVKADGSTEMRKFTPPAAAATETAPGASESTEELEQVWKAKDGQTFKTKALAKAHNDEMAKAASEAATPAGQLATKLAEIAGSVAKLEEAAAAKAAPVQADTAADAPTTSPAEAKPADVAKKDFADEERQKAADSGDAMPDGSYPIKSKADLSNAVKAFGRAKNKKAVKAHIIKRATDLGAQDALPDSWKPGADKAVRFGDLQKGMYEVSELACLIQALEYQQQRAEMESEYEKDNSTIPASLKEDIANLCATFRAMVEEETNELLSDDEAAEYGELLEMSDRPRGIDALTKLLGDKAPKALAKVGAKHSRGDQALLDSAHDSLAKMGVGCGMAKAGARHSKDTMAKLGQAHDLMKAAGAMCKGAGMADDDADGDKDKGGGKDDDADKSAAGDLAKVANLEKKNADLEKSVAASNEAMLKTVEALASLQARIKQLEEQPLPHPREIAKGHRVVTKGAEEIDEVAAAKRLIEMAKTNPEQLATELFKFSLNRPAGVITQT